MDLNNNELNSIVGGKASRYGLAVLLGGLITLITGMIDGYFRPLKCNKWN